MLLLFLFTAKAGFGQTTGPDAENMAAQLGTASIEVLETDMGDLTGDGSPEFAAAVQTENVIEGQRERLVVVFRWQRVQWVLWKSSSSPILGSEDGGVLGDPFAGLGIQDQRLHISHFGGSNWRWSMYDAYCHEGEDLILSEHRSYWGAFCEEKVNWEIHLSEGRAQCAYGREECPEGFGNNGHLDSIPKTETFEIPKGLRITLEHRKDSAVHIVSPVHGFETTL